MILCVWGDFSTQIHFVEIGMKRGTFVLIKCTPSIPWLWTLFLVLFKWECLYLWVEKVPNAWEIFTIPMQPYGCEEGRGLMKTFSYAFSRWTSSTCWGCLVSILITFLSIKSCIIFLSILQSWVRWSGTLW